MRYLKDGREVSISVILWDFCQVEIQVLLLPQTNTNSIIVEQLIVSFKILLVPIYFEDESVLFLGLNPHFIGLLHFSYHILDGLL